jgi:hypothetical protein
MPSQRIEETQKIFLNELSSKFELCETALLIRTNDDVRTALIRYRRPTMANQMIGVM